ncbi:hypothetical protein NVV31_23600 [Cytobacillus firmus]|uniref:hypothetical protein n=1 Tax=Cytobacillus firmus TaxID=1399 RepID=UPI0021C5AEEA|nr:hypothetical protein [Cytobacillus firmus]MCU1808360.1 hypothetical protein [Cytobacillus firmus]
MRMLLDAEEKYAYDESISNFLTLKIWHDLGINVKEFPDYIVNPGGYDGSSFEILESGLKALYPRFRELNYEDEHKLETIAKESNISSTPERLYLLNNIKVQKLIDTGEIDKLKKPLSKIYGNLSEFEMSFHKEFGLVLAVYFTSVFFEVAEAVANITRLVEDLYKQIEDVTDNGLCYQAI